jgi:vacuolar-type H+-ATPase subunit I/STV1
MGASSRPRRVPEEDDDDKGSTEHHTKLLTTDAPSGKEIIWFGDGRLIELERQLSDTLIAKTQQDRRVAQLTDELARKSALLEQAEANAAEARKRAELEQRELQVKLGELLLSRDQELEQAQSALQKATFRAAEANERSQRELAEVYSRLDERESELAAVRLRLADTDGWAKSRSEADTSCAETPSQAVAGLVDMDMGRVMRRLMERVRTVEVEMALLRGNEKSIESMECRNEG